MTTQRSNEAQRALWDGPLGEAWTRLQPRYDAMLEPFCEVLLEAAELTGTERVLDVGCGCGATTLAAAKRLRAGGEVVGVDLSSTMLARARERAAEAGISNLAFMQLDVQEDVLPRGVDVVLSRAGVMSFEDPVAAFTNVRSAMQRGARLAFVCWRGPDASPLVEVPLRAVRDYCAPIPSQADGPSMLALADPKRTQEILARAGFERIALEAVSRPLLVGGGGDAAFAASFLWSEALRRMFADAPEATVAAAVEALATALKAYMTPAGVVLEAGAWLVRAVNAP